MGMMWRLLEEARKRLVGDRRAAMMADRTVSVSRMIRNILNINRDDAEEYKSLVLIEGEAEVVK